MCSNFPVKCVFIRFYVSFSIMLINDTKLYWYVKVIINTVCKYFSQPPYIMLK